MITNRCDVPVTHQIATPILSFHDAIASGLETALILIKVLYTTVYAYMYALICLAWCRVSQQLQIWSHLQN